jgi:hypothetical protein
MRQMFVNRLAPATGIHRRCAGVRVRVGAKRVVYVQ